MDRTSWTYNKAVVYIVHFDIYRVYYNPKRCILNDFSPVFYAIFPFFPFLFFIFFPNGPEV